MKKLARKLGFTLMEVNLAIFIMATGVLAMVSLYPLGYRENEQSRDDVKSAAIADAVLNQLHAALSSRNITWQEWENAINSAQSKTSKGWMSYCDQQQNAYTPKKKSQQNALAKQVFDALSGAYKDSGSLQWTASSELACALVAQWGRKPIGQGNGIVQQRPDHSRVALSFRCSRNAGALFSAPIYYTEIHFQGDQEELQ